MSCLTIRRAPGRPVHLMDGAAGRFSTLWRRSPPNRKAGPRGPAFRGVSRGTPLLAALGEGDGLLLPGLALGVGAAQRLERLLGEVVAPRLTRDGLGQDLAVESDLDRAVEGRLVGDPDPVGGRPDDPVDLVELPRLVALGKLGVVLEHDVDALPGVVAAEDP